MRMLKVNTGRRPTFKRICINNNICTELILVAKIEGLILDDLLYKQNVASTARTWAFSPLRAAHSVDVNNLSAYQCNSSRTYVGVQQVACGCAHDLA